ncbi:MAG: hypothetical protein CMO80_22385 [Verrucomicrobiales bacterium]|nr:hypothetical protein [Verrucomicrobiales bacterium]|tara:strand:+ start:6858 stop:7670 length:813 start_codon:yes stop_codon:yes gene_type:complete
MQLNHHEWPDDPQALSLTELLVVIGIIAIIAALLLTAVGRSKGTAQKTGCINNQKQLITTWTHWSGDNNDRLVPSHSYRVQGERVIPWVTGMGHPNKGAMTNRMYLTNHQYSAFSSYVGNVQIYKCPSNRERIDGYEAIRSYSMNAYMGRPRTQHDTTYRVFEHEPEIVQPDHLFVFADQNQKYICWPMMMINMEENAWINLPASHHNYGGTFSFADGHVEYKKWYEETTAGDPTVKRWIEASWPKHATGTRTNDRDLTWVREHATIEIP